MSASSLSRRSTWIPVWASLVVLVASGAYLAVRWTDLPARWVIHWGPGGVPNGWATRTWPGVFGPLLIALSVSVVLEVIARLAIRGRVARDRTLEPLVAPTVDLVRLIAIAVALLFSALAIMLPLGPHLAPITMVLAAISLIGVAALIGGVRVSRALASVRAADPKRFEGYSGLGYSNPKDSRLFVPKLMGMGWTINFAHRLAWPILALLLGVPLLAAVVGIVVARH